MKYNSIVYMYVDVGDTYSTWVYILLDSKEVTVNVVKVIMGIYIIMSKLL